MFTLHYGNTVKSIIQYNVTNEAEILVYDLMFSILDMKLICQLKP